MSDAMPCARLLALDSEIVITHSYALTGDACSLGRAPGCDLVVQHPLVSRLHARIERNGMHFLLVDAGSVNGTFINGRRLSAPHLLRHDDEIGLGSARPILRFDDPEATEAAASRLRYDDRQMRFLIGDQAVALTPMQVRLLRFLYEHAGEVCSRDSCARAIWGDAYRPGDEAAALDQQLAEVRRRLRAADPQGAGNLIVNRRGLGYVLNLEE
ncbi:MAG: FHA domain-containing protein [Oscillochloridaceae bacterium]|nr:FHA domain-containing protein [Chloroflexaceae bacterium]MDW8388660.1 FHA domain-containing protein [Oscillochloridaceae bacterium]